MNADFHSDFRFDASLRDRWTNSSAGWSFAMPTGWTQGRSVFGGLTTAAAVALAHRELEPDWKLRTASMQFLRPAVAGDLAGTFTLNRQGKNVTFAESRVLDGEGAPALIANLAFIKPRVGAVKVEAARCPELPPADTLPELPFIEGVVPEFTKQVAFRWARGGFPFSGSPEASFAGYVRFRVPFGDVEGVLGLLDAWPCPSLTVLNKPTVASSVMWTAHILEVPAETEDWFAFTYDTVAGADGFHTAVGRLFDSSGAMIGWTEQLVIMFA